MPNHTHSTSGSLELSERPPQELYPYSKKQKALLAVGIVVSLGFMLTVNELVKA